MEKDFKKNTMEMKLWFFKGVYAKDVIEKELGKIKFCNKVSNKKQKEIGRPFVVTYYPILKNIGNIIRKKLILFKYR